MTMYAAAPRGVKLEFVHKVSRSEETYVAYFGGKGFLVLTTFEGALNEAIAASDEDRWAYEVVMLDDRHEIVGHSNLIASCGVVYEMVDDDELDARIKEGITEYE